VTELTVCLPVFAKVVVFSVGRLRGGYRTLSGGNNPANGGPVKGETQMTRVGVLITRALIVALLLLSVGGGVASADPGNGNSSPSVSGPALNTNTLPDDPGYSPEDDLFPDDPGFPQ